MPTMRDRTQRRIQDPEPRPRILAYELAEEEAADQARAAHLSRALMRAQFGGTVQRKPRRSGQAQQAAAGPALEQIARSGGEPLPEPQRGELEAASGEDLSEVRVHTGAESARAADALDADAFTIGSGIHFGAGKYAPASREGQRLIAHETAHTIQQSGASGALAQAKTTVSSPGDAHEVEADRFADAVANDRTAPALTPVDKARLVARKGKKGKKKEKKSKARENAHMVVRAYDQAGGNLTGEWEGDTFFYGALPVSYEGEGPPWKFNDDKYAKTVKINSDAKGETGQTVMQWAPEGSHYISIEIRPKGEKDVLYGYGPIDIDPENVTLEDLAELESEEVVEEQAGYQEGTGGTGDEPVGAGTGKGEGDDPGAGERGGFGGGHKQGSKRPSWTPGGVPGVEGGRIGDEEYGRHWGRHGGEREATGHAEGAGWLNLIDAPEEIAPLVNAGILLSDANILGFGSGLMMKKLSKEGVEAALEKKAKQLANEKMREVRKVLRKDANFKEISSLEKNAALKDIEELIEREYYGEVERVAREQIRHFKKRAADLPAPQSGGANWAMKNAEENAKEWEKIRQVAAVKAGGSGARRADDAARREVVEGSGMHVDDVEGSKKAARHDRAANKGTTGTGSRTPLADAIPEPGPRFNEFWDSLSASDLERLLADGDVAGKTGAATILAKQIRHPFKYHEWLMVAEIRKFKKWGISMETIKEARSLTKATIGRYFRHGGKGSGAFHRDLRRMIRKNDSYEGFLQDLNEWADINLVSSSSEIYRGKRGRFALPANLQRP
jgi:hypothetical protein